MATRIEEFKQAMEAASGQDLRMFMFTRDQLQLLQAAMGAYKRRLHAGLDAAKVAQVNRWIEAFDPDWKE